MFRKWTPDEAATVKRLRAEGLPAKVIAKRVGRSATAVNEFARRAGVAARYAHAERVAAALRRTPADPDRVIAERIGVARSIVHYHRTRLRIRKPRPAPFPAAARARLLRVARLRWDRDAAACARDGWPVGCTTSTAEILELIEGGTTAAAALARECGRARGTVNEVLLAAWRRGWVTRRRVGRVYAFALAPAVVERRERRTPGLVVCLACNAIAPRREGLHKLGWHRRDVGRDVEIMCGLCFAAFGWGK